MSVILTFFYFLSVSTCQGVFNYLRLIFNILRYFILYSCLPDGFWHKKCFTPERCNFIASLPFVSL